VPKPDRAGFIARFIDDPQLWKGGRGHCPPADQFAKSRKYAERKRTPGPESGFTTPKRPGKTQLINHFVIMTLAGIC